MSKNYIVINGKRAELTEEQMKVLGIEVKKNPFDRVSSDDRYYYTIVSSDVLRRVDINDRTDRRLYDAINYFSDKAFAEQVALHQLLYRKLLQSGMESMNTGQFVIITLAACSLLIIKMRVGHRKCTFLQKKAQSVLSTKLSNHS